MCRTCHCDLFFGSVQISEASLWRGQQAGGLRQDQYLKLLGRNADGFGSLVSVLNSGL